MARDWHDHGLETPAFAVVIRGFVFKGSQIQGLDLEDRPRFEVQGFSHLGGTKISRFGRAVHFCQSPGRAPCQILFSRSCEQSPFVRAQASHPSFISQLAYPLQDWAEGEEEEEEEEQEMGMRTRAVGNDTLAPILMSFLCIAHEN